MLNWNPMEIAIEVSTRSIDEDQRPHPKVGAVATALDGSIMFQAWRGQFGRGDHAEFILTQKIRESGVDPSGLMLYSTLEPCSKRGPGKVSCAERIVESGISNVFIGIIDPNPEMSGAGVSYLQMNDVNVFFAPKSYAQKIIQISARHLKRFDALREVA